MSNILSRDAILAVEDLPRVRVEVPEWGGALLVTTMTGEQRERWERDALNEADGEQRRDDIRARLVSFCVVDEAGNRLFGDADVAALARKSGVALDRLFAAAQKLNRLRRADLDELEGN